MHNINYIGAIKCISTLEFDYIRFMYICCSSSLNFCSDYMHFFDSLFFCISSLNVSRLVTLSHILICLFKTYIICLSSPSACGSNNKSDDSAISNYSTFLDAEIPT